MLFFGGHHHPVYSRLGLDIATLMALGYAVCAKPKNYFSLFLFHRSLVVTTNALVLSVACIVTLITAGPTKRWTISLPLVPIVILQIIRLYFFERKELVSSSSGDDAILWTWVALTLIRIISVAFVMFSAILCALFPAVKISQPMGKYNVGIVDLHLPVKFDEEKSKLRQNNMVSPTEASRDDTDSVKR